MPCHQDMTRFVRAWFAGCSRLVADQAVELCWTNPRTGALTEARQYGLDDLDELIAEAVQLNLVPGQNVYVRVCTVRRWDTAHRTTSDDRAVQVPGLWRDWDDAGAVEAASNVVSLLRPTFRVVTGSVPYRREHGYFLFGAAEMASPLVRACNERLCAVYGGDRTVVNLSRMMRLPGSIAWPYKPGRLEAELTALVVPEGSRTYAFSVVVAHLGAGVSGAESGSPVQPEGMLATLSRWDEVLRLVRAGAPGWHNSMVALVGHWVSRGWTAREILAAAESFRQPGFSLEETLAEVGKAVDGAFRKQFEPEPGVEGDPSRAEGWDQPGPAPGRTGGAAIELLHYLDVLSLEPPGFLVEGLLPAEGLSVVYGEPKSGKTFLVLAWAVHIVAGLAWHGRAVRQGAVVYIAAEGIGGMGDRIEAAMTTAGVAMGPELPFYFIRRAINFLEPGAAAALIAAVRAVVPAGVRVAMVVIDTLARGMPGGDENSAQHLGLVIAAGGEVQAELHCAVVPIHHAGKDATRGMRGSTALRGAVEASFLVTREEGTNRVEVKNVDQKDAEPAAAMTFDLVKVELPPRAVPGRLLAVERSSMVLRPTDIEGDGVRKTVKPRGDAKVAMEALVYVLGGSEGAILPPGEGRPEGVRGCAMEAWRHEYYARRGELTEPAARRQAFNRAIRVLTEMRLVGRRDPYVWMVDAQSGGSVTA